MTNQDVSREMSMTTIREQIKTLLACHISIEQIKMDLTIYCEQIYKQSNYQLTPEDIVQVFQELDLA